jgi:hypothetical protein
MVVSSFKIIPARNEHMGFVRDAFFKSIAALGRYTQAEARLLFSELLSRSQVMVIVDEWDDEFCAGFYMRIERPSLSYPFFYLKKAFRSYSLLWRVYVFEKERSQRWGGQRSTEVAKVSRAYARLFGQKRGRTWIR